MIVSAPVIVIQFGRDWSLSVIVARPLGISSGAVPNSTLEAVICDLVTEATPHLFPAHATRRPFGCEPHGVMASSTEAITSR